mgnify:CR=1 FL=1|jgi:hypothetical protein
MSSEAPEILLSEGIDAPRPGVWEPLLDEGSGLFGLVEATTGSFVPVGELPDW